MYLVSSWFPQTFGWFFVKLLTTLYLFLLESNMCDRYSHCTFWWHFLWFVFQIYQPKKVESLTLTALPTGFTLRRRSRTRHTIFLSDGTLKATGCCSEPRLPGSLASRLFGSPRALLLARVLLCSCKTSVCSKWCVTRKLTPLFFPSSVKRKWKSRSTSFWSLVCVCVCV